MSNNAPKSDNLSFSVNRYKICFQANIARTANNGVTSEILQDPKINANKPDNTDSPRKLTGTMYWMLSVTTPALRSAELRSGTANHSLKKEGKRDTTIMLLGWTKL